MATTTCPVCGKEINRQSWTDEVWGAPKIVETHEACTDCGYESHDSYGQTHLVIGRHEFGFSYTTSLRQQTKELKRFKRAVRHARRVYVRRHTHKLHKVKK